MKSSTDIKNIIIETARKEFSAYGYTKISMSDLAEKLGISKKTFYKYFTSKEELLLAAINSYISEVKTELASIMKEDLDFLPKAKKVLSFTGTQISSQNPYFLEDMKENAPLVWQKVQTMKEEIIFNLGMQLMDEGVRAGVLKKDINKTLVVMLYAVAAETIITQEFTRQIPQEFLRELPYSSAGVFDGLLEIIFRGILKE